MSDSLGESLARLTALRLKFDEAVERIKADQREARASNQRFDRLHPFVRGMVKGAMNGTEDNLPIG